MKKVAIVGAGITGLSTAHYLRQKFPDTEITIFERSDRLGGNIRSEKHGDFTLEFGAAAYSLADEEILQIAKDINFSQNIIESEEASRQHFIYHGSSLQAVPQSSIDFIKSPLVPSAFTAFMKERKIKPLDNYDSTKTFSFRHFGREIATSLIEPMVQKKTFGDTSKLSTNANVPELKEIERTTGSLFKSKDFSLSSTELIQSDFKGHFNFKNGLDSLCQEIVKFHNLTVLHNQQVKSIEPQSDGKVHLKVAESDYTFDHVFVTTPSHVSAHLLRNCDQEFYKSLGLVKYAPLAIVNLVYDHNCITENGNGYSIAGRDRDHVISVRWNSSMFPAHSKKNHSVISVILGGMPNPQLLDKPAHQIVKHALSHLRRSLEIKSDPVLVKIRQYSRAMPQYTMGVEKVWARLDSVKAKYSTISLLGNYQYGVSVGDCVRLAKKEIEKFKA